MSSDADSKPAAPNRRAAGVPTSRDDGLSPRGIPLTTIGLCGLAMILVGSGMRRAAAEGWWVGLVLAGVLILILYMGMGQERWLTRERHRLIMSALKRTGVRSGSGHAKEQVSRRTRTRRGGRGEEKSLVPRADAEPPPLGEGRMSPGPPPAPEREPVREEAPPKETTRVDRP